MLKIAISLRFDRSWQYVLYAALLLGSGLFVERFRLFDRLRRRLECGNPCHL